MLATSLSVGFSSLPSVVFASESSGLQWSGWSDSVFEQAKKENRFVILDLEAVWCHWCHVMEEKTYHNPEVMKILKSKFIPVRVDQDSRPDLSNRYMDYGWPATVIYAPNGTELAKRAGYIPPEEMVPLLKKLVANPVPEPDDDESLKLSSKDYSTDPFLAEDLRKDLEEIQANQYDTEEGGWSIGSHKFMDWDSVEYAMAKARTGDKEAENQVKETLKVQVNLLDPVWGGIYQYSTHGDWKHPHFEKIMSVQAENLRIYAQAYSLWKDPAHLDTAEKIYSYLENFLSSPEGAYYTSQDADLIQGEHSGEYFALNDAERRKLGMPRIDKHSYARENGWVINALAHLYIATQDETYLKRAEKAMNWVLENRSLPDGGFRHDEKDVAGPYLGDTISMGRAFLTLYQATGNRDYLNKAQAAAKFIDTRFKDPDGAPGYISAENHSPNNPAKPLTSRDENVLVARFANLLAHYTGDPEYRTIAANSMRFLATPSIADQYFPAPVLLADSELSQPPLHITIVGHKDDQQAQQLFEAAVKYPSLYKRVEWWDKREGPMPNPDVEYPELEKAAAFVCTNSRCSLPVFKADDLASLVHRITNQ